MEMKGLFSFLGPKKDAGYYLENGEELANQGKLDEAEKALSRALEMADEDKDYDRAASARVKLGRLAETQNRLAVAEAHYNKAFRHYQDEEEWEMAGNLLLWLGTICRKQRRRDEAIQLFGTAQKYFMDVNCDALLIADAAERLSGCCLEDNNFQMAEKHLKTAIEKRSEKVDAHDLSISRLWKHMGVSLAGQNKDKDAEEAFKKSLAIHEKNTENEDRESSIDLCSCLHEYGRLLLRLNRKKEAKEIMERADKVCQEVPGYLLEADLADDLKKLV